MLVKFLNSGDRVSTTIAGSYFKGDGWTGAYYDSGTGQLVFESEDGLGFITEDLRVATGGTSTVEWTTVLNKPTSFPPSAHTHPWADISGKPTEFTPVSHNHTISQVTDLQSVIDAKADKSQILTQQQFKDSVAAMFQSGTHTNVSINYDPVVGTLNLSTAGGGGASVSEEDVQDWVGNLVTQGTGISVNYDDVGNVLSIELSGVSFTSADKSKLDGIAENATANSTDSQLRERSTHTGTQAISTISGLQAALTTATDTLATLQAEIAEARSQLAAVATFASPNAGGIVPGRYYDNATGSTNSSLYTGAANRVDMVTFITSVPLTVNQIGFAINTPGSGAYARAFIYSSGADGWPKSLMYESNSDLDLNSGTFQGETLASPFTFEANRIYWIGWRFGTATTYATMRGVAVSSVPNMGLSASNSNTYCSVLRRNIPFNTPMPVTWVFDQSELAANIIAPSFRMRAA